VDVIIVDVDTIGSTDKNAAALIVGNNIVKYATVVVLKPGQI
jgi:hypothetical protein